MQARQIVFADAAVADDRLGGKIAVLFDDSHRVADIQRQIRLSGMV
jgi:hypothetical protein